jgi:hypothetical protein
MRHSARSSSLVTLACMRLFGHCSVQGQGVVVVLSPLAQVLFDSPGERMYNLPKEAHRLPLRLGSASRRSTAKWGNCAQVQNAQG